MDDKRHTNPYPDRRTYYCPVADDRRQDHGRTDSDAVSDRKEYWRRHTAQCRSAIRTDGNGPRGRTCHRNPERRWPSAVDQSPGYRIARTWPAVEQNIGSEPRTAPMYPDPPARRH